MAISITPVVTGAAVNGPPPPAPSIYRKAIRLPSCDQRGRAAYPFKLLIFLASEASAFTVQSCRWFVCGAIESLRPVEKNASVFESGDHDGSESLLSAGFGRLTSFALTSPETSRMCVSFDVVAAVDCTHARWVASGERAMSPNKTVFPSCSVNC